MRVRVRVPVPVTVTDGRDLRIPYLDTPSGIDEADLQLRAKGVEDQHVVGRVAEGYVRGRGGAAGGVGDCCAPLRVVDVVDADCGGVGEEDAVEGFVRLRVGELCVVGNGGGFGGLVAMMSRRPADAGDA